MLPEDVAIGQGYGCRYIVWRQPRGQQLWTGVYIQVDRYEPPTVVTVLPCDKVASATSHPLTYKTTNLGHKVWPIYYYYISPRLPKIKIAPRKIDHPCHVATLFVALEWPY